MRKVRTGEYMTNVRDTIKLETEIRTLKKELNECQTMYLICNDRREEILQENKRLEQRIGELLNEIR